MRAWVVCVKRKLPEVGAGEKPSLELHIWQVPVDALPALALALNSKSITDPSWFLTPDGPAIIGALSEIGVSPLQCRVKFAKQSMDRVYFLNLPRYVNGNPFQVLAADASLALKVVDGSRYAQEADSLRKIAQSDAIAGFYALGAAPSKEGFWFKEDVKKDEDAASPKYPFLCTLKVESEGWWSHEHKLQSGGVIIMRVAADRDLEGSDRGEVAEGVKKTLKAAHQEGIIHTDIRRSNILFFDDDNGRGGWQLIDFGLSAKIGSSVEIQVNSNLGQRCGNRIVELVRKTTDSILLVEWQVADDFAMLDRLRC
jgi:hypothetical protein